jgi:hypothetical protein
MNKTTTALLLAAFCIFSMIFMGCGIYSFNPKGTLDPEIKSVNVHIIETQAQ